ncbi:unnamed protein product, partial [Mesorhabditis belari]|uniref:Apple domain-containing protein n=1 Tax=Mesorhabditis belari TaxID=2138241 RepID=A0AAF3FFN3_9BILA
MHKIDEIPCGKQMPMLGTTLATTKLLSFDCWETWTRSSNRRSPNLAQYWTLTKTIPLAQQGSFGSTDSRRFSQSHKKQWKDPQIWRLHKNASITRAVMFDRSTGGTCEECLEKCTQAQHGSWRCRSLTYDWKWSICDLFAVTITKKPFNIVSYEQRSYFEYIKPLIAKKAHGVVNEKEKIEEEKDFTCVSKLFALAKKFKNDREILKRAATAIHGVSNVVDKFIMNTIDHKLPSALVTSNSSVYVEKLCIPDEIDASMSTIFAVRDHLLVGFVEQVETTQTFEECIEFCVLARERNDHKCKSAMWYGTDTHENCLLNSESRRSRPQVFTKEDVPMIYFELPQPSTHKINRNIQRDQPFPSKWTQWSLCGEKREKYRFKKCSLKDIRKCVKQRVSCE